MTGELALNGFIDALRKLGAIDADAAKLAAPLVLAAAKKTARAGTTPDGKPWPGLKAGGGRALVNAADALSVKAVGTTVVLTLSGINVLQNFGTSSIPARQILPDGGAGMPRNIADALTAGAQKAFAQTMGGGR